MIRINLLPEEFHKKAKTPVKLLLAFALMITVNGCLLAYWGWAAFAVAGSIESERSTIQLEMDGLSPQVAYHKSLEGEAAFHKSREDTLTDITKSRISWTRKIDELIDVVNRGKGGERHLIWFNDLHVLQAHDPRTKNYGTITASGHSGSSIFAQVADFLDDLETSPFITDFNKPAAPEGNQAITDEELVPSTVWAFPLRLALKSPDDRAMANDKGKEEAR